MATEELKSLPLDPKAAGASSEKDLEAAVNTKPVNGHQEMDAADPQPTRVTQVNGEAVTAQEPKSAAIDGKQDDLVTKESGNSPQAPSTVQDTPMKDVDQAAETGKEAPSAKRRAVEAAADSKNEAAEGTAHKGDAAEDLVMTETTAAAKPDGGDAMGVDSSIERQDLVSTAEEPVITQDTSAITDGALATSPQELSQSVDVTKLDLAATQGEEPTQDDTAMEDRPAQSPTKTVREREPDASEEPSAKRIKTDDQNELTQDSIGVATGIPPSSLPSNTADEVPDDQIMTPYQNRELRKAVAAVKKTKSGYNFRASVENIWPDLWGSYKTTIETPVDLTLFEAKLRGDQYPTFGDFKADLRLLHANAYKFNGADHVVTVAAGQVRDRLFGNLVEASKSEEPTKPERAKAQPTRHSEPRAATQPRQSSVSRAVVETPKPKTSGATTAQKPGATPTTPASATAPAFALPPSGVPLIRRDSTRDDGDRPKRPIKPPTNRDPDYTAKGNRKKKLEPEARFLADVLAEVKKQRHYPIHHWFLHPVDPVALNIPDYFNKIKKPMDIQTMTQRLEDGEYRNIKDFEKDIRLIVTNSETFNGSDSEVTRTARQLEELFQEELAKKDSWMTRHYPSLAGAAAASPEASTHDSEEESEEEPEEDDNEVIRTLQAKMSEEQDKLNTLLSAKNPNGIMIELQQGVLTMVQRKLVDEKNNFALNKKPKQKKKSKARAKAGGGAAAGAAGAKKATAPKKTSGGNKKASAKKRTIGPMETAVIADGINELDGPVLTKAVDIIKKDTNQKEDDDGQLELDIDLLSLDAKIKLYDLITRAYPNIYDEVAARPEFQQQAAEQARPKAASAPKPKKNKPMNKHEQERNIEKLRELKAQFQRQGSGSQEPGPGEEEEQRGAASSDEEEEQSDSEEE